MPNKIDFKNIYNSEYIKELTTNLIKEYSLEEFVLNLNILDNYNKKSCANYYPSTKTLNIHQKSIYQSFYMWYSQYNLISSEERLNRGYGIYLLKVLLHELTHASQYKEYQKFNTDSLGIIINEGIELGLRCPDKLTIREKILYNAFHDRILTEKNAECNSRKLLIELNDKIDFLSKNELIECKNELIKYLDYGYTKKSACENYYLLRGKHKEYTKIPFNENYNDFTRKSWGMPL
jgi:hypothetical protein